jgi:hypothetical protein
MPVPAQATDTADAMYHTTGWSSLIARRYEPRVCAGQSLIEACLALLILCLFFMGFFQVSQLVATRQVLYHAAARGARAKMVGLNRFMVEKAILVAAIPNAGRMVQPDEANEDVTLREWLEDERSGVVWDRVLTADAGVADIHEIERARIPEFMGAQYWPWARAILDYEHWDTIDASIPGAMDDAAPLEVRVRQQVDLHRLFGAGVYRAFYANDILELEGKSRLEAHYPLYIDDEGW